MAVGFGLSSTGPTQAKCFFPNILAGVEQAASTTCVGVEAADIRPLWRLSFSVITPSPGDRSTVVLLGNGVVGLEGQNVEQLREPAVFAGKRQKGPKPNV